MNKIEENPMILDGLVGQAYSSALIANEVSGTIQKARVANLEEFKEVLKNQINILNSEIQETLDAITNDDMTEILDGACDVFVVASGLLQIMEARMQAREALLKVTANNLTKFIPANHPKINEIISDTVEKYSKEGITVAATLNKSFNVVVFVDASGKWRKPSTYVPVDITNCVSFN